MTFLNDQVDTNDIHVKSGGSFSIMIARSCLTRRVRHLLGLVGRSLLAIKLKSRTMVSFRFLLINTEGMFLVIPTYRFSYALVGEPLSVKYISRLFKSEHMKYFLDIGAGIGTYFILVSRLGGISLAIEPDPIPATLISINAKLNNVKIEVNKCYLGDSWTKHSRPLDSFNIEPDVIKIDVDGAELSVLKGGIHTLKRAKYILIEMRDRTYQDVHQLLKSLNFKPIIIEPLYSQGLINKLFLKQDIMPDDFNVLYHRI